MSLTRYTCSVCWRAIGQPGTCNACAQPAEATPAIEPTDPVAHVDASCPGESDDAGHEPNVTPAELDCNKKKKQLPQATPKAWAALPGALVLTARRVDRATIAPQSQPSGVETAKHRVVVAPLVEPDRATITPQPDARSLVLFKSSNIDRAELLADDSVVVTFVNGSRYRYANFNRKLLEAWSLAESAGAWFHREVKVRLEPGTNRKAHPNIPLEAPISLGNETPTQKIDPNATACSHTVLRELAGGVCPICPSGMDARVDSASAPVQDAPRLGSGGWPPGPSGLLLHGEPRFESAPTAKVRPPLVEPPPIAPSGVAHGPLPDYMRRPLRTLTRAEATGLLLKLQARRMRARLSTFIRGGDGTGKNGAWAVLEGGELDWNFHHDALCDHTQIMLEEWYLAGLKRPEQVEAKLTKMRAEAELDRTFDPAGCERRIAQVEDMIAHWKRPVDECITIKTEHGERYYYGCGGGKYIQRTNDLAINVGPISLKSRIVMVFAVAWMWLEVPHWEVFCSSGTPSNVSRDSLACRDLVTDAWYRDTFGIGWTIRDDEDRIGKWSTTAGGSRESKGSDAKVTGIHCDAILIDDPDDAKDVWSDTERKKVMVFWKAVGNRLKDPTRPLRLIVQQNLHEEDLTTRIVGDGVPRLAIPVEFSPVDRDKLYTAPFGWVDPRTNAGELLQASRFTPKFLADERVRLGSHGFEAQYNCNPRPIGGGLIQARWFRFFRIEDAGEDEHHNPRPRPHGCVGSGGEFGTMREHPTYTVKRKRNVPRENKPEWTPGIIVSALAFDWCTLSVDATFGSLKDTASAVGLGVFAGQAQRRFVLDDQTEPRTFKDTVKAIIALIRKWPIKRVLIEKKANGAPVIEELELLLGDGAVVGPDGRPACVVVDAIEVPGGKESRAAAMVPSIEAGLWYLLEGAPWLGAYVGEVTTFPNAKRDDRVDMTSQLATYYREPDVVSKWRMMAGGKPRSSGAIPQTPATLR